MSEAQTVKTLIHEASHQALHSKEAMDASGERKSKNQKETEAESVAYVVCKHYGIDTSDYSFPYVATWSADKEVPELKASLDTIRKAAAGLIVKIDEKIQSLSSVKEMEQFMEAHGNELPFDNPEVDKPLGYIQIEPPVDFSDLQKERPIKLSVEAEKDTEKKPDKKTKEKQVGKTSVKEKLKSEKAKYERTKTVKKTTDKDMREAI